MANRGRHQRAPGRGDDPPARDPRADDLPALQRLQHDGGDVGVALGEAPDRADRPTLERHVDQRVRPFQVLHDIGAGITRIADNDRVGRPEPVRDDLAA